jgi:basic membrane lipoprotein Med (substrate-binding protein (PBP1-ABC) superfamily)
MSKLIYPTRRRFMSLASAIAASSMLPRTFGRARAATSFPAVKEEDAVMAWAYVGPVSDEGWTWSHNQGLLAVKEAFPKIKTLEVESVPYSADATRIFRQFVSDGASIVFDSSNYGDLLYAASDAAPEVAWLECDGRRVADNLGWYYVAHWYPTYVIGVAAGMLSKSGNLGYVGSFPVPSVYSGTNAFLMGARTVDPKATVQCIMINSWFDPQGANQAGTALVDNGCDFLFGIMDEAAYLQVAEKRGVWAAMWNTDIRRYGPKAYVSSVILDWKPFYVEQARKRLAGEWAPAENLCRWVAASTATLGARTYRRTSGGRGRRARQNTCGFSPFVGEIKDNTGAVRVKEGETMSKRRFTTGIGRSREFRGSTPEPGSRRAERQPDGERSPAYGDAAGDAAECHSQRHHQGVPGRVRQRRYRSGGAARRNPRSPR